MTTSPEKWRIIPAHPLYKLSDRGFVLGPSGKILRPFAKGSSSTQIAVYGFWVASGATSRSVRALMREVWGVDFSASPAWMAETRRRAGEIVPVTEMAGVEAPDMETAHCAVCGSSFQRVVGSDWDICGRSCQKKKKLREAQRANMPEKISATLDLYAMQTLCQDCPSWDCPAMDPLTNRMEPGVWIDVPHAAALRRTAA